MRIRYRWLHSDKELEKRMNPGDGGSNIWPVTSYDYAMRHIEHDPAMQEKYKEGYTFVWAEDKDEASI